MTTGGLEILLLLPPQAARKSTKLNAVKYPKDLGYFMLIISVSQEKNRRIAVASFHHDDYRMIVFPDDFRKWEFCYKLFLPVSCNMTRLEGGGSADTRPPVPAPT